MEINIVEKRKYRQLAMCPKCSHTFKTKSRSFTVCCSRCNSHFRRIENIVKEGTNIVEKRKYRQLAMCPKCSHTFKTKSRSVLITCHRCNRKFKRKENIIANKNE